MWKRVFRRMEYSVQRLRMLAIEDVVQHDFLLAKLEEYGVGEGSCVLLKDYLSGRQQRVKIGDTFYKLTSNLTSEKELYTTIRLCGICVV